MWSLRGSKITLGKSVAGLLEVGELVLVLIFSKSFVQDAKKRNTTIIKPTGINLFIAINFFVFTRLLSIFRSPR
jgi:hypothetical protein